MVIRHKPELSMPAVYRSKTPIDTRLTDRVPSLSLVQVKPDPHVDPKITLPRKRSGWLSLDIDEEEANSTRVKRETSFIKREPIEVRFDLPFSAGPPLAPPCNDTFILFIYLFIYFS